MSEKRLFRSSKNRVIAGVSGGLGEYFELDPIVFRLIFILLAVFGGSGIVIYLIMWILIPETGEKRSGDVGENLKAGTDKMAGELRTASGTSNFRLIGGLIIVLLGVSFLLQEFFPFWRLGFDKLWPLILIAVGIAILSKSSSNEAEAKSKKEKR